MRVKDLHPWDVAPKEARRIQEQLAPKVSLKNKLRQNPKLIAGCDISTSRFSKTGYAGVVLLDATTLAPVDEFHLKGELGFPYVPGLLSFREGPLLIELFRQMPTAPDLIFFDGQGLAHPRRFGLACHMGLVLGVPAIGVAKSLLTGTFAEPGTDKGACSPLLAEDGSRLGTAVRTRTACKPVFVSPGHAIDFETAAAWTLRATGKYRIPEPTRLAHSLVNRVRKSDAG
ncbi:MAG: deoxyribonuclease V [Nitrospina sp.]|nr:deoxyribonuclease V [Nitrospina sp.]